MSNISCSMNLNWKKKKKKKKNSNEGIQVQENHSIVISLLKGSKILFLEDIRRFQGYLEDLDKKEDEGNRLEKRSLLKNREANIRVSVSMFSIKYV